MFLGMVGGIGMMAGAEPSLAAAAKPKRLFLTEAFYLKNGTQAGRLHDFFKQILPLLNKHHSGPKIYLEALVAPHMPQIMTIYGMSSPAEMWEVEARMHAEQAYRNALEELEAPSEPACEYQANTLLEAADYCPEIKPDANPRKTPRVFELRVYHSPTYRQLRALHERFAGPEIKIFHRSGIHPILYSSTIIGPNMPNLTYLTPFDSLAAREKAWAAFGADPEWVKVRKESVDKHGQVSSIIQIALYRATPYSPVQ